MLVIKYLSLKKIILIYVLKIVMKHVEKGTEVVGSIDNFVMFSSDNENLCYAIDNEIMIESIIKVFEKIYANIQNGLIKTLN